jgi:acyl-CoA synthetase (AMP-forming)/AMP-acid ligase II
VPDDLAFLGPGNEAISYRELDRSIRSVSEALKGSGILGSVRVAVVMPRSAVGLALFLGVSTENICCPMSPGLKGSEVDSFLAATEAVALIVGPDNEDAANAAHRRGILVIRTAGSLKTELALECIRSKDEVRQPGGGAGEHALLLQTSGTTSKPKIVLLKHSQILRTVNGIRQAFALAPGDVCLNPMPFQHAHGLITAGLSSLMAGSVLVCLPGFSPDSFDAALNEFRPTWFTAAPAMHVAMLEYYSRRGPIRNSRLRFIRSSSAPLPSSIIADLEVTFGAPLIETYGLTETATMIATNPLPPAQRKVGSVGVACAGAEIRIELPDGENASAGSPGDILIRGPSVITHYGEIDIPDPDNFKDGWLRTGDVGYLDGDGFLFVVGRTKELIKRGGLSVYPTEIDNVLMTIPGVSEAASFSIQHETLGEDLVAAVVLSADVTMTEQDIRAEMFSRVSSFKVPSAIIAVSTIPKSETGKTARRDLSSWFSTQLVPQMTLPCGKREHELLEKWHEILGRKDLGVTDNLLLYGADPIRAERIQEISGYSELGLAKGFGFRYPTVRLQASQLELLVK